MTANTEDSVSLTPGQRVVYRHCEMVVGADCGPSSSECCEHMNPHDGLLHCAWERINGQQRVDWMCRFFASLLNRWPPPPSPPHTTSAIHHPHLPFPVEHSTTLVPLTPQTIGSRRCSGTFSLRDSLQRDELAAVPMTCCCRCASASRRSSSSVPHRTSASRASPARMPDPF